MRNFSNFVADRGQGMYKTKTIKVVVYGLGTNFHKAIDYIDKRFIIVGCSDRDYNKQIVADEYDIAYYLPSQLHAIEYDYILITSVYDEPIRNELIYKHGIDGKRVLLMEQWQRMEFIHSFGEQNPEITFYLISKPIRHNNGIVSLLNMYLDILYHIEGKGYVPVIDLQTYKNQYLDDNEIGEVNAWEKFFEQLAPYSVDEVLQSKNVILGYDEPGYLHGYMHKYNICEMSRMFNKYIHFKPSVQSMIEYEKNRIFGDKDSVIGVLYRGTDMTGLKLKNHMIQPSLEELYSKVIIYKEKYNCNKIYLSTEDVRAIDYFKEKVGDILIYTNQLRYGDTGSEWIANLINDRQNDRYLRGAEYLVAIYLLSQCKCLVSGIVAGSIGALIMNDGQYEEVCMIDKGIY